MDLDHKIPLYINAIKAVMPLVVETKNCGYWLIHKRTHFWSNPPVPLWNRTETLVGRGVSGGFSSGSLGGTGALLSRPGSIILEHAWVTSHFEIPLLVNQSLRMFPPCVASYIHRRHQNPWHAEESRGQ